MRIDNDGLLKLTVLSAAAETTAGKHIRSIVNHGRWKIGIQ